MPTCVSNPAARTQLRLPCSNDVGGIEMIYARQLTEDEVLELRRMMRQETGRVSQRAHMVLLSASRHSAPEIAELFEVCPATTRFWLRRFDEEGTQGLYDDPHSGRPRKADRRVELRAAQLLHADPQQSGYLATFWTVPMLVPALARSLTVELSVSSVRVLLHRLELRWGRPGRFRGTEHPQSWTTTAATRPIW